jgi:plastocyanin
MISTRQRQFPRFIGSVWKTLLLSAAISLGLLRFGAPDTANAVGPCVTGTTNTVDCVVDATNSFTFSPQNITVQNGVTVTWDNTAAFAHTTTNDPLAQQTWNDPLNAGQTASVTFNTDGDDPYYCTIHGTSSSSGSRTGMIGDVMVIAPTAARVAHFAAHRTRGVVHARWYLAVNAGVEGFYLSAGHKDLGTRLLPVHGAGWYSAAVHDVRRGHLALHTVLMNGSEIVTAQAHRG